MITLILNLIINFLKNKRLLLAVGIIVFGSISYFVGRSNGYNACKVKWDTYIKENAELNNKLQAQFLEEKKELINKNFELSQEIMNHEQTYQHSINNIRTEYSDRLHKSEKRALYYQSMSSKINKQGCTSTVLANHTTRLDRQLTEGISLVKELRELIKLRDSQLKQCGEQVSILVKE